MAGSGQRFINQRITRGRALSSRYAFVANALHRLRGVLILGSIQLSVAVNVSFRKVQAIYGQSFGR